MFWGSIMGSTPRMTLVAQILREQGYAGLANRASGYLYRRTLRRMLPEKSAVRYADIAISRDRKVGDMIVPKAWVPADLRDIPNYEEALISGIRAHVRTGDRVVVVGGGEGVTATIAAQMAGETGSVICFEGAGDCATKVEATAVRNDVAHRLTVRRAVVGAAIGVYGSEELRATVVVDPAELPTCDVLELDCEGAEVTILSKMAIVPRSIIVETHGLYGAPTVKVRQLLEDRGYDVVDLGWAEPSRLNDCKVHDIRALVGTLRLVSRG